MRAWGPGILAGFAFFLLVTAPPAFARDVVPSGLAPDRGDPQAIACDRLVDPPNEPQRVGPGVSFNDIDVGRAMGPCQAAAMRRPARPRYQHLYGVVLEAAHRESEAATQYAAASGAGYGPASIDLAALYVNGVGIARDIAKAQALLRGAADAGYVQGYLGLGLVAIQLQPPDYAGAVVDFSRAVEMGSTDAGTYLGQLYLTGAGVTADVPRAIALFAASAAAGDPLAELDLAIVYYNGDGVARDPAQAAKLLVHPAQSGYPQAADLLAQLYYRGDGVPQSDALVLKWYLVAAAEGEPIAMTRAGEMLEEQDRTEEAVTWYRKAAEMGVPDAEVDFANALQEGEGGLHKDPAAAVTWLEKAAAQNNRLGQLYLADAYRDGNGVARDNTKARELYEEIVQDPKSGSWITAKGRLAELDGKTFPSANFQYGPNGWYEHVPPPANTAPTNIPGSGDSYDLFGGGGFIHPYTSGAPQAQGQSAPPTRPQGATPAGISSKTGSVPTPVGSTKDDEPGYTSSEVRGQDAGSTWANMSIGEKAAIVAGTVIIGGRLLGVPNGPVGGDGPQTTPVIPYGGGLDFNGNVCYPRGTLGCP